MLNPINTAQKIKENMRIEWKKSGGSQKYWELKATLTAKKEEWQNEIEFLNKLSEFRNISIESKEGMLILEKVDKIIDRINELKKAVEIANG